MSTVFQPRLFTEDEYLYLERKSEERCEFFRGEIFSMAGATFSGDSTPSRSHPPISSGTARATAARRGRRGMAAEGGVLLRISALAAPT